jgi:hypothetical protein
VKHPAVYIVFGDTVFQGEQRFQPGFFGFSVQFDVFPAFGEGRHRQKGDDDTFDKGTAFFRSIRGSLMSLKKSMMGGTVSGIIITSSLTAIAFFIPFLPLF